MKIIHDCSIENRILLFSHLVIRSLLPKQHQFPGFSDFINELSVELDCKTFKGKIAKIAKCNDFKPIYVHHNDEEYRGDGGNSFAGGLISFTGLFGVIFAVAVLYSIRNR